MITIARKFVEETTLHSFTAEIAELMHGGQLPKGSLPRRIIIPGVGNGNAFVATHIERNDGDLQFVKYHQIFGCVALTIFND